MDNRHFLRGACGFLMAAMLLSLLISCGGETAPADSGSIPAADTTASAETAPAETKELTNDEKLAQFVASIPDKDYGGYAFRIVTRNEKANAVWKTLDVVSEGENGEPINDAVFLRNRTLEEKLNIVVTDAGVDGQQPNAVATKSILAGEDSFDVVTDGLNFLSKMSVSGYLIDYNTIPGIHLDNEWWDNRLTEGLSLRNKIFFATGDISIMDNTGTWNVLFNKSIAENMHLDNHYQAVENGTWTLDKMHEQASKAAVDLDGDGQMTKTDRFGFLSEEFNTYALWVGSGEKMIGKDKDDVPYFTMYNERSASVVEKVIAFQCDAECTAFHALFSSVIDAFKNEQGLYFLVGMRVIPTLRDMETEFGIIPAPKFSEDQDSYYGTYSFSNFVAYSVPVTIADAERTGVILEAMAGISRYTLTNAYYDITLLGKVIRDDESAGMIDIILHSRSFDLGSIFNWGKTFSIFSSMTSAKSADFASRYTAVEATAQAELEAFLDSLQ